MGKRPWHLSDPAYFEEVKRDVVLAYPDLQLSVQETRVRLAGPFRLLEADQEIDRYEIEIVLPLDFPGSEPDVFEMAGRIKRDADHHMYGNGRSCLFAPGERWRHWPRGSSLVEYLNGPVRSFFIGQALYERTGEWPFHQRRHGALGIVDAYGEMLRTRDIATILRYIKVLSRRKLRPWTACPCGSGKAIHSCHMTRIADARAKVSRWEARTGLEIIEREIRR